MHFAKIKMNVSHNFLFFITAIEIDPRFVRDESAATLFWFNDIGHTFEYQRGELLTSPLRVALKVIVDKQVSCE